MIGSLMMCVSAVILLVGMLAGLVMGIEQNFMLGPAHAHLNLIGGALLFLFGLYYRLVPAAGTTTLAKVQGWLHIIGAVLFPVGVAVVLLKGPLFEAAPSAGSLIGGDGAVCGDRVPLLARVNGRRPLPPPANGVCRIGGARCHFLSPSMA
jgi:hypothetical protein